MYQNGAFVLDVRTVEEWNEFHAPDSTLIPLDQLASRLNEVPRDRQIVVVCRSGNRSQQGRDISAQCWFCTSHEYGRWTEWIAGKGLPCRPLVRGVEWMFSKRMQSLHVSFPREKE